MDLENIIGTTEEYFKDNGRMEKEMAEVFCIMQTDLGNKGYGEMINAQIREKKMNNQ